MRAMSSYVESPYIIEHRRLQGIVIQCEKELQESLEKMKEIRRKQDSFQKNIIEGQKRLLNNRQNEDEHKQSTSSEILERCKFIERMYTDVIDTSAQIKLDEIKVYTRYGEIDEELLMNMLNSCEEQLVKKAHDYNSANGMHEIEDFKPENRRQMNTGGKRGVKLKAKKYVESSTIDDTRTDFEYKMEIVKSLERYQNDPSVLLIEKEYMAQPDFAKALYACQNIAKLDSFLQEEIQKRKVSDMLKIQKEKLKNQYEALLKLTESANDDSIPEIDNLENMSIKTIESVCENLQKKLVEKRKKEYVSNAIRKVMEKHGIVCCNVDEGNAGVRNYQYDESIDFDISGVSQNRFIAEMSGKYYGKTPTIDERRKSVKSAKRACDFLKKIRDELEQEYGIIFDGAEIVEPSESNLVMKTNNSKKRREAVVYSVERKELMFSEL